MRRSTQIADRTITLVSGVKLTLVGLTAAWWAAAHVPDLAQRLPVVPDASTPVLGDRLDLAAVQRATEQPWWPWAMGAAGLALVLLGLVLMAAHLPRRSTAPIRLPDSGPDGRLTVAGNPLAEAAADSLAKLEQVRSAHGRVVSEGNRDVVRIDVQLEPYADLAEVAAAADTASAQLRQMLRRPDITCRVALRVSRGDATPARVR